MSTPSRWSFVSVVAFLLALFVPRIAFAQATETCPEDWKKKGYLGARDSVVSIETVGFSMEHIEPVAGIVYPTRSYVVAISNGAGIGRGVTVHFPNGKTIRAEPVAFDEQRHVTILRLAEEGPAPPLRVSDRPLEVGMELVNVAPFEGATPSNEDATALDSQIHVGHVANVGDRTRLRFDATWAGSIGGPLLDCSGDVVGFRGWGAIVPAKDILAAIPSEAPVAPVDVRRWSALHMHLGMVFHGDDRARVGASTGLSLVQGDRWQLRFGFGALASLPTNAERERKDERLTGARLQLEHTLGYRILLTDSVLSTYLVPQIGIVGRLDIQTRYKTESFITDVGCIERGGPCKVDPKTSSTTSGSVAVLPAFGASLMIPGGALGYQLQLDVQDPSRSTHQIFFGFEF